MKNYDLLIGTYTRTGESDGIYALAANNGALEIIAKTNKEVTNPTYLLAVDDIIYTIESNADKSGGVGSYQYKDKKFTFIDKMITEASGPCHLDLDKTQKYIVTSHYHAGKLEMHQVDNGTIVALTQIVDHTKYQDEANPVSHVHFAQFTNDNKYIIVCDLGLDRVFVYPFDENTGHVDEENMWVYQTKQGSGPRHFVLNNAEDKLYVLNELSGTLLTFAYHAGKLELLNEHVPQALATHSSTGDGAAIRMHPNGKYLYISHRSTLNTIVCYQLDNDGIPQYIGEVSTKGDHPRDFNITPDGKYLFVANQFTNDIFTFEVNADGMLKDLDKKFALAQPVCIVV